MLDVYLCDCVCAWVRARVRVMRSGVGNINACDLVSDPMYMKLVRMYLQINLHIYSTCIVFCGKCPFCTCSVFLNPS